MALKRSPFSFTEIPQPKSREASTKSIEKIVILSSYSPRKCGVGVFAHDTLVALRAAYPKVGVFACAVNDTAAGYAYDQDQVRFEIGENDTSAYQRAADYINYTGVDIVLVEHEYGLYGRDAGSQLLTFLRGLRNIPVITVLHTILQNPDPIQRKVLRQIMTLSSRVITMAQKGKELLSLPVWSAPLSKVRIVPHPIPDTKELPIRHTFKAALGLKPSDLHILTFGLLGPGKSIETAIKALRRIVDKYPNVRYIVLGATHPGVLREHGESYRNSLVHLAQGLGLTNHIVFVDQFVELPLLTEYISAADVYCVPYLGEHQITSGTLSYAYGIGSAVVSTPFWHAKELLDCRAPRDPEVMRGLLFPFGDSEKLAEQILTLLDQPDLRHRMQNAAFEVGRSMTWPASAKLYYDIMLEAIESGGTPPPSPINMIELTNASMTLAPGPKTTRLPTIPLQHLIRMTDDTGIIQHAYMSVPRRSEGYCLDDVTRAVNLMTQLKRYGLDIHSDPRTRNFADIYMAFIAHSFESAGGPKCGRFKNFMSYDRQWIERESGSEDSHGRTLQALAACFRFGTHPGLAGELFLYTVQTIRTFKSLRAIAFSLVGLRDYCAACGHRECRQLMVEMSNRLHDSFKAGGRIDSADWPWPEDIITYDNAILAQALVVSGRFLNDNDMLLSGQKALKFIWEKQVINGVFVPVGNDGWAHRDGRRGLYDQQSLEAGSMVLACLSTMHATDDRTWYTRARRTLDWYFGRNSEGLSVYDSVTGGCHDALQMGRVNLNQGAEALLSFLLALAAVKATEIELGEVEADKAFE